MIRTEDGHTVAHGDRVFDYYSMAAGVIAEPPDAEGWFTVRHDRGTTALLNGERICTIAFAQRKGWV